MAKHAFVFTSIWAVAVAAAAQDTPQTVTVTGSAPPTAAVAGFDDAPLSRAPFSATVIGPSALSDAGIANLADIARVSPGLTDAYNAVGYWSNFTVRGYALDQRNNYRRDGLPINAETSLWLGNKQSVDVLRGTSGMQAGVSAPGGLVDLVVKRPNGAHRSAVLGVESDGTYGLALDLGDRAGPDGRIGWRLSAEATHLDPPLNAARGKRQGIAAAGDWRIDADKLLEAEIELNHQSQPSQPGFSMLGNRVPDARDIDPRINLNNQPWSLPVVFTGETASLRWTQRLGGDLSFRAHAMTQWLRTDDRIAFPFGCSAEGNFDRYCSDGTFDFYDFRSEGEHRRNDALDLSIGSRATWLSQEHRWRAGVLGARQRADIPRGAFNFVGTGTIDGLTVVPPDATVAAEGVSRDERSLEAYARDQWLLTPDATLWLGLRYTHLTRHSVATDGSGMVDADQNFTAPWLAASLQLDARTIVYASAGQGIEAAVAPNVPIYSNANQVLPAQKSHQLEAGIKYDAGTLSGSAVLFDIRQPFVTDDPDPCVTTCTRLINGEQHHRGIELDAGWRGGPWSIGAGATLLRTTRERSIDPADDARKPTNVPERSLRAALGYQVLSVPELTLSAAAVNEGSRFILPDNSASIPSWTRLDLSARLVQRVADSTLTWRVGVDNAANRRAWRESPFQFAHVYLYPLAPRTWRASLAATF
jgi:iron complex outermembrane receptor protein